MTYLIGLIVIGLFFLALHYLTELSKMEIVYTIIIILSILSLAVMYNQYTKQESQKILDATLKFKQGKTLKCDGKDVNSTNYTLSIGTYTFIGKKNTPYYSEMISASSCQ